MSSNKSTKKSKPRKSKHGDSKQYSSQTQKGGFPNIERVRLVYTDIVSRAPSGVVGTDYVFMGNGLFDPDVTGTGHQCINYDDFSAIYNRYRVLGSSIKVMVNSLGSLTGTGNFFGALAARHTSSAQTTLAAQLDAASQPMAFGTFLYAGTAFQTFTMSKTTAAVLGYETSAVRDDDTLQALTNASPAHPWYWHIMTSMSDQSSSGGVFLYVTITYDVEFFDRVDTASDLIMRVPVGLRSKVLTVIAEDSKATDSKEKKSTSSGWGFI